MLTKKGSKRVGNVTSWERGKNITLICTMSAAGTYVPPVFIFPRQRVVHALGRDAPAGSLITCSKKGWTNDGIFLEWLNHFKKYTNPTPDEPVLLILDNHNSHISTAAIDFCVNNNIHLLTLPPHCSHRVQPLDVTFFGPLKKKYQANCDDLIKTQGLKHITPYDVAGLFSRAYNLVATPEKGIKGFACTGIWPYNPDIFENDPALVKVDSLDPAGLPEPSFSDAPVVQADSFDDLPPNSSIAENVDLEILSVSQEDKENRPPVCVEYPANTPRQNTFQEQLQKLCPVPDLSKLSNQKMNSNRRQQSEIYTSPETQQKRLEKERLVEEKRISLEEAKAKKIEKKAEQMRQKEIAREEKLLKATEKKEFALKKQQEKAKEKEKKREEREKMLEEKKRQKLESFRLRQEKKKEERLPKRKCDNK